jgi:hypothetical protein
MQLKLHLAMNSNYTFHLNCSFKLCGSFLWQFQNFPQKHHVLFPVPGYMFFPLLIEVKLLYKMSETSYLYVSICNAFMFFYGDETFWI